MLANSVKLNLSPNSDEVMKHEAETLRKQVISFLDDAKLSGKSLIIRTEGNRGINQATMIIEVKKSDLDEQFKGFLQNIMISLKTSTDSTVAQKGSIEILRNAVLESKKEVTIEIPGVYNAEIILKVLSDEKFDKTYRPEEITTAIRSYYQTKNTIDNGLTPPTSIEEGYVRLAIVKEKEQREKEEKALVQRDETDESRKDKTDLQLEKNLFRDERNMSFEDIYGTKSPIELTDLFRVQDKGQNRSDANSVIILGRPGIGKSTACQHIAYQWSKPNGLFNDKFDLIIWVPLRNRKRSTNPIFSL